jgi:hypothetical protein
MVGYFLNQLLLANGLPPPGFLGGIGERRS